MVSWLLMKKRLSSDEFLVVANINYHHFRKINLRRLLRGRKVLLKFMIRVFFSVVEIRLVSEVLDNILGDHCVLFWKIVYRYFFTYPGGKALFNRTFIFRNCFPYSDFLIRKDGNITKPSTAVGNLIFTTCYYLQHNPLIAV